MHFILSCHLIFAYMKAVSQKIIVILCAHFISFFSVIPNLKKFLYVYTVLRKIILMVAEYFTEMINILIYTKELRKSWSGEAPEMLFGLVSSPAVLLEALVGF